MPLDCENKCGNKASMKRPKTGDALCQPCFFAAFEAEVHQTIVKGELFKPGDSVAIGASGGKDSTVLAYVLKLLNERHNYGLELVLLSVDEGITGYRDDSLETVKRNELEYGLPLTILSYKDLYGWTMDEIVREVGKKNNCTFCGVFRRQALDRGAVLLGANKIVTGHNADDVAETIFMNLLRGDVARLQRCTAITTGAEGTLPRCKPFKYTYEKEIVMYAYFKKLDYFSTECIYSPNAYRGHVRTFIKDLERVRPRVISDIIFSGEQLSVREGIKMPKQGICERCKYISSMKICKACVMLEGLNKGLPKLGIGKSSKVKGQMKILEGKDEICRIGGDEFKSGCASQREGKQACCGRGGGCSKEEKKIEDSVQDTEKVKQGKQRSLKKRWKARERMNATENVPNLPKQDEHDTTATRLNDSDNASHLEVHDDDDGLHDFFGCGGFATSSNDNNDSISGPLPDDEVGTIRSKMEHQNHHQVDIDIENLGQLAATMLHMGMAGGRPK